MPLSDPIWAAADTFADTSVGRRFIRNKIDKAVDSDGPPSLDPDMAQQILKREKLRKVLLEESTNWINNPDNHSRLIAALKRMTAKAPVEKQASLQEMTEAYQKNIGGNPLLDTAALSAGSGLLTYLASGPILRAVTSAAGVGSPQIQAVAQQYFSNPENVAKTKRRLAILAATAGALYGAYKHGDWTGGMEGFKASMTDPEYWKKNPDRVGAYAVREPQTPQQVEREAVSMEKRASATEVVTDVTHCARCGGNHRSLKFSKLEKPVDVYTHWALCPKVKEPVVLLLYDKDPEDRCVPEKQKPDMLHKLASQDPYYQDNIYVPRAMSIVGQDPVLFPQNKARIATMIHQSADGGSHTSGIRLTDTAVQSGVDFGAAYMFGQGLGKLLSMSSPVVDRLSAAGGVAAAVIGSGVLSKIGF